MSLSNDGFVACHYRSYGTFCIQSKRLHNFHGGFTHYRNYRATKNRPPKISSWRSIFPKAEPSLWSCQGVELGLNAFSIFRIAKTSPQVNQEQSRRCSPLASINSRIKSLYLSYHSQFYTNCTMLF